MSDRTGIEWTDATWNPVRGCTRVSEGCRHCYAERVAGRFAGPGLAYEGLATGCGDDARWTGAVTFGHDLEAPLRWQRPRRIFVNSMSDLFHEKLAGHEIATVFAIAVAAHHLHGHTFQILTKRAERMRTILATDEFWEQVNDEASMNVLERTNPLDRRRDDARATLDDYGPANPPPGLWLGVSCEDQATADARVPELLATPAAIRFVSAEPLLGPILFTCIAPKHGYSLNVLDGYRHDFGVPISDLRAKLDWVIVGGESGPQARPMHPQWARDIRDQCARAKVAFFFKQWGEFAGEQPPVSYWASAGVFEDHAVDRGWCFGNSEGRKPALMPRVGKKAAGRLLDGVAHDALPQVPQ